ncbi:electron transfer flavoprotein subunit beta/FixA family protein [Candidatus Paracaedibacter symbiosus]|uniref:electron transfer flavoprotein subunit beta/FixA family protein n=1 Tax=Candidatus Paracaedibacter symbiosus TaxID=244582 RepID=UPI000509BD5A|nr:electron transfer flavoprotein subunit beta/FixA family protein [Candidatus Paracaedibacter symbiosus]
MKVLVAVKRVVDYNVKVRVKSDGSDVDIVNVKMSMNPFDEIAVEEAVRLKEKGTINEIVAVSLGSKAAQDTLRQALALGADRAIHIESEESPESLTVAKALKHVVSEEKPDLVILGKQAIDDDCNQVGQMLAALLDWPQGTFISALDLVGDKVKVAREIDGGLEEIELTLPAIITTDLRLNTPRYATLPNIMKAKQKPLSQISLDSIGIDSKRHLKVVKVSEPPLRQGGKKVSDISEIVEQIRRVI